MDADLVLLADIANPDNLAICPTGLVAAANTLFVEEATSRPLIAQIFFCDLSGPTQFELDLVTAAHELLHGLGLNNENFKTFVGFSEPGGPRALQQVTATVSDVAAGEQLYLVTPQARRRAQEYFLCPKVAGMLMEDMGTPATRGQHFEEAVYWVRPACQRSMCNMELLCLHAVLTAGTVCAMRWLLLHAASRRRQVRRV